MRSKPFPVALIAGTLTMGLAACGGSGGGGGGSTSSSGGGTSTTPTDTGSVSASFVAGSSPRYLLIASSGTTFGGLGTTLSQNSNGSIVALNTYTLTGTSTATHDIAGDAGFALGRWIYGTVTNNGSTVTTLTGSETSAWHYLVYNRLAAMPATNFGTTCDAGTFTTSTRLSGGFDTGATAATTGSATLSFAGGVAAIGISLTSTSGSASNTFADNSISVASTSSLAVSGTVPMGNGAWVTVADGDSGSYRIVGIHSTVLSNGAGYRGLFTFNCTP